MPERGVARPVKVLKFRCATAPRSQTQNRTVASAARRCLKTFPVKPFPVALAAWVVAVAFAVPVRAGARKK